MRKRVTEQGMFGIERLPLDDLIRENESALDAERSRRVRCYERYWLQYRSLGEDFLAALEEGQRLLDADAEAPATFITCKGAPVRLTSEVRLCSRCQMGEASVTRDDGLCGDCRWTVKQGEIRRQEIAAGMLYECSLCGLRRRPHKARAWWVFSGATLCPRCSKAKEKQREKAS